MELSGSRPSTLQSVLMVTPNLYFPFGGPPVTILKIAYALREAGMNIEIAYPALPGSTELEDERLIRLVEMGVQFRRFGFVGSSIPILKWGVSPGLLRYVWKSAGRFDLVMLHQIWGLSYFAKLSGKVRERAIQLPHESLSHFDVKRTQNPVTHFLKYLQLALDANTRGRLLFSSHIERNTSFGIGRRKSSAVAYHPLGDWNEPALAAPQRSGTQLAIGFIGRLHPKKNVEGLIRALPQLQNVKLIVAGSGGQEMEMKALARTLAVEDRIEWLGFISSHAKEEFYRRIDISAVPSVYECFGQSAAEAMLRGVPLLCTSQIGAAERLEDGISCIRCELDAATIADAVRRFAAISPAKQKEIGMAGRAIALQLFSNDQFVSVLQSLFEAGRETPRR